MHDQFVSLPIAHAANRLRRRHTTNINDLVDFDPTQLGDGQKKFKDFHRMNLLGRISQQINNVYSSCLDISLEVRTIRANVVCPKKGVTPLSKGTFRNVPTQFYFRSFDHPRPDPVREPLRQSAEAL